MYQKCEDPLFQDSKLLRSNSIVIDMLKSYKHKINSVMDLGCGKGYFSNLVYEVLQAEIDAIDISNTAIDIACKRYPKINFIQDNIVELNNITKQYDVIIISQVLWYILDDMKSFLIEY